MDINKIIFLDLDGVLNIINGKLSTAICKNYHFEPSLVDNLNIALEENPDLFIVMSSSWRDDMPDAIAQMKISGFKYEDRFIGNTRFDKNMESFRDEEIKDWISENKFIGDFLIIDDFIEPIINGRFVNYFNESNILEVNPMIGLSSKDIKYISSIFS